MTSAPMQRWLGYDWFKLVIMIILILLLLTLWLSGGASPAAQQAPAAATAVAVAQSAPVATALPAAQSAPTVASSAPLIPTLAFPAGSAPGMIRFTGKAAANAQVQVLVDGKPIGTAKASSDGRWSLEATIDAPGDHAIVAQALDANGAAAAASEPATITLAAPTPQIAAPSLNLPSGSLSAGPFNISGTGTPNMQVEVMVDGQSIGKASVSADGSWRLPSTLTAGDHDISVRALDASGAAAASSSPIRISVAASAAPAASSGATAIGFPADGAQIPSAPFTMTGTGTPGSKLEVLDSDKVIGTVTVGADGTWSLPITPSGSTAAYSTRPAGSSDVTAKPIRVTIGDAQAGSCASLASGCDAWVTRDGGLMLRMRAGAGASQPIIAKLPVGTQMRLLEGPQPSDGHSWWRVRTLGGHAGWVAGEELRTKPD